LPKLTALIAGRLQREYILPPVGPPLLDSPGGSLLYAAGGLALWGARAALLGRVGEDYPQQWLRDIDGRGFDVRGIRIDSRSADLRYFAAYGDKFERSNAGPVAHFARRGLTLPRSLLGYRPPATSQATAREPDPLSPTPLDMPAEYRALRYAHICPMDLVAQTSLVSTLVSTAQGGVSLDPSPEYMARPRWREVRALLRGVTAFQPAEEELRSLFWGETNDLWEMAEAIAACGPQTVVVKRGARGQYLYEAGSRRRWEITAYASRLADPTGAGDAFSGGFLAGLQKSDDPLQAVLRGNVSASLKLEGSGPFYPMAVMPGLAEARLHALQDQVRAL
jgi:ribokinase